MCRGQPSSSQQRCAGAATRQFLQEVYRKGCEDPEAPEPVGYARKQVQSQLQIKETIEYFIQFRQTLGGPFSAVSTATIATKYSFFQDFRDLQDFHTFAPLRSQNFSKKVVTILSFLNKLNNLFNSNFMKNALKLVFFFEILMKFCRNFTNIFRKCQHFRRIAENSEKIAKIWSKSRN